MIPADRRDAREHHPDVVGVSQLAHRLEVALDLFIRHGTGIAGDIVGAGQDHHDLRLEIDHVGPEAQEHLRCRLPADASIEIWLARKESAVTWLLPAVGDGVAHEDHTRFSRRRRLHVEVVPRYRTMFAQSRRRTSFRIIAPRAVAISGQLAVLPASRPPTMVGA